MRDLMTHRGPDDAGVYLNKNIGLAHRRLSIIDVAGGYQPLSNEDDTVWIIYNGEIYNYLDLKETLKSKGHVFKTNSDTEVILHAYEEFGVGCLEYMRGMFAFAIWDDRKKQFFGARDRLGIKPFYYYNLNNCFIFSSEIKSILLDERVNKVIDDQSLFYYLNVRYIPAPYTIYKDIFKLEPGHYVLIKNNQVDIRCYWDVQPLEWSEHGRRKTEDVEAEFMSILQDCVRMRLMSEVPLGVLLSGGIDSSMVVALMSKIADQQIKTFSVGYEQDYGINEFSYARIVARKFGADHHEIPISTQDFYSFLPRLVWHLDEPISDPATIPLFFLAEFSRKSVTVVLSGEGADEILAGYYIYKKMLLMERFRKIPKAIRETLIINLLHSVFKSEKHRKYLNLARLPLEERYRGVSRAFQNNSLEQLLKSNSPFQDSLNHHYNQYYDRVGKAHPLNKMLYVDLKNWLPDDLLMKADKMTMAASQELRVPFLDHRLVEFAFSLSPKEKINGDSTKHLLRKIAAEILPQEIIKREKKGFPVPINHWFRGDLNQIASEVLLDSSSVCAQYFDLSYISSLLNEHGNGLQDYSENIWNLIILEFWHKTFMKN